LPDVPTMAEAGYPGLDVGVWFGLAAPAGTPAPIVGKLHDAFVRAVHDPEVLKQFSEQGVEPVTNTPAEFAAFIVSETARLGKIIHEIGAKATE
jgi:tripartite-type tricarboxylate transporter receptor subunit TctC